jgi:hypothetical protein
LAPANVAVFKDGVAAADVFAELLGGFEGEFIIEAEISAGGDVRGEIEGDDLAFLESEAGEGVGIVGIRGGGETGGSSGVGGDGGVCGIRGAGLNASSGESGSDGGANEGGEVATVVSVVEWCAGWIVDAVWGFGRWTFGVKKRTICITPDSFEVVAFPGESDTGAVGGDGKLEVISDVVAVWQGGGLDFVWLGFFGDEQTDLIFGVKVAAALGAASIVGVAEEVEGFQDGHENQYDYDDAQRDPAGGGGEEGDGSFDEGDGCPNEHLDELDHGFNEAGESLGEGASGFSRELGSFSGCFGGVLSKFSSAAGEFGAKIFGTARELGAEVFEGIFEAIEAGGALVTTLLAEFVPSVFFLGTIGLALLFLFSALLFFLGTVGFFLFGALFALGAVGFFSSGAVGLAL